MFYRFFVYFFLPFLFYSSNLQAVETPSSPNVSFANDDFYLAVDVEYSFSDIEIGTTHASVVAPEFLTPGYPDMEIDYLGGAESNSLHPSLKLGYRFPFVQTISIEAVITPKHTLQTRKSGTEQLFQKESMDLFWSSADEEFSDALGNDYVYSDLELSGSLAELDVFAPQLSLIFRPVVHKRLKLVAGLGVHYLMFSDFEVKEDALQSSSSNKAPSGSIQNAMGWIAQLGVEYELTEKWFIGTEMKYSYVGDVKVSIDDLYVQVFESSPNQSGAHDPFAPVGGLTIYMTSADTRLNIRTTAFSLWAGFNF